MPWTRSIGPSLIDTIDRCPVEWWLVYTNLDRPDLQGWVSRWCARNLKRGYQHVQALHRDGRVWIAIYPHAEFVDVRVIRSDATPWQLFPGCIVQHVVAMRPIGHMYSPFHLGPWTCVEVVKSLLGIRSLFLRTPWQLYQHVDRGFAHEKPKAAEANRS